MANLLYTWELGGELGHISQALPLALAAKARGHEITLALKDVSRAESVLQGYDISYLQAPVWLPQVEGIPHPPTNYTEILFQHGYLDTNGLLGIIMAWRALYAISKPALVIADHAPTALLAAHSMGIPRTMLGTGFYSPPRTSPLPSMRPWLNIPQQRLVDGEQAVLKAINQALTTLVAPPLQRIADLFPTPENEFMLSFAELDHYPNRQSTKYLGAALSLASGVKPVWPDGNGKKLFAYLKPQYTHIEKVLEQLAHSGARVLVYAGNLPETTLSRYASARLKFSSVPFDIVSASQQCDAAICHAGHGTVSAFLLAGKPLLLLPMQLEQFLLSRRVVDFGAGLLIDQYVFDKDSVGKLQQLLTNKTLKKHARTFAEKYQSINQKDLLSEIILRCESIISQQTSPMLSPKNLPGLQATVPAPNLQTETKLEITMENNSNELFQQVLRLSDEPFTYFDERTVHCLLTDHPDRYFKYVRKTLVEIADGVTLMELPPKQIFTDPETKADFRIMPCVVRNKEGARKTVKLVGTNTLQKVVPDQITVGKAFAIHPTENFVSHIFEACLLSSARTGICAALAVDLLSESRCKVTIIGAGRVGYYAGLYISTLDGVEKVIYSDTDMNRAKVAATVLSQNMPGVHCHALPMEKLDDTDVLVIATTSMKHLYSPENFSTQLVVSLGADTDTQHELDPRWAALADIFVDSKDSARYGDLLSWQELGTITVEDLTDLFSLIKKTSPLPRRFPRIFISTGTALFDNLTIGYLLERTADQSTQPAVAKKRAIS
ncbi:MAG: glycosyltransferase [Desulfobulbaceae bacterium]|nr:glycosyltransferase [Desulfobulbaceae bacterium]